MQLLANTTSPYGRIARICLIEKGIDIEPTVLDPWSDDPRLRDANAATRVPTLILDDGTALTESLLITQWVEQMRPAPRYPSLLGGDPTKVISRAGIALGVIDAAVHTIIIRKVTAPVLFDETPVGLRRRRTMAEGIQRLEAIAAHTSLVAGDSVTLDAICAVTALDYLRFRFNDEPWMPPLPSLDALSASLRGRRSFAVTMPYLPS